MADPTRSLKNIFSKIQKATSDTVSKEIMGRLGNFAVDLVVKRTRLGYGVSTQFGQKTVLKPLSRNYKDFRAKFKRLSATTSPGKSNLTLTGQMLESVKVIRSKEGSVRFGPTGGRYDSNLTNLQVAARNERSGRVFNRISQLEYQQILREYRREFGDLLKKRRLIT